MKKDKISIIGGMWVCQYLQLLQKTHLYGYDINRKLITCLKKYLIYRAWLS